MGPPLCEMCSLPATVYCRNDEAHLCANCDMSLHDANPLSHRHERVSLATQQLLGSVGAPPADKGTLPDSSAEEEEDEEPLDFFKAQQRAVETAQGPSPPGGPGTGLGSDQMQRKDTYEFKSLLFSNELDCFTSFDEDESTATLPAPEDGVVPFMAGLPKLSRQAPAPALEAPGGLSAATVAAFGPASHVPTVPVHKPAPSSEPEASGDADMAEEELSGTSRTRARRPVEKRRRKVERVIRYPSRKAYADIRPRIKGRFATKAEVEALKKQAEAGEIPA